MGKRRISEFSNDGQALVCDFWRDGRNIVWSDLLHSKPSADSMRKIVRGIAKFVFKNPEPLIVQVNHDIDNFREQSIHEPRPTITQKHE